MTKAPHPLWMTGLSVVDNYCRVVRAHHVLYAPIDLLGLTAPSESGSSAQVTGSARRLPHIGDDHPGLCGTLTLRTTLSLDHECSAVDNCPSELP